MTFRPELCALILAGRKTVTRRPCKSLYGDDIQPCRYQEGRDYALQPGRGKKAVGRIEIWDIELQPLSDALHEYREEGFPSSEAFTRYWHGLYGSFDPDLAVWRIEFSLLEGQEGPGAAA